MALTSVVLIPTLAVGSLYYTRRQISSKWINLNNYQSDTIAQNLNGKVILITGGNTGLGFQVAKDLAKRQGTVVIACRDAAKASEAQKNIIDETGNPNIDCLSLDLADLNSVDEFCSQFTEKYPKVYSVICNAGVFFPMEEKLKTLSNYEINFGINHLGHFALIKKMIPHLQQSGMQSRIIMVSSGLMKYGKIDVKKKDFIYDGRQKGEDEKSFFPTGYCDSKLMNALTVKYLAKTFSSTNQNNVSFYTACPGMCSTDLGRHINFSFLQKLVFTPIMRMFTRSALQGAQNILHATLEDEKILENGGIYRDGQITETESQHVETLMRENVDNELWDLSEQLLTDEKK